MWSDQEEEFSTSPKGRDHFQKSTKAGSSETAVKQSGPDNEQAEDVEKSFYYSLEEINVIDYNKKVKAFKHLALDSLD